jgi:ATP adenylyltransferase
MDRLFAPWRIEWVEREERDEGLDGCPFCVLPEWADARESRVVAANERAFVLLNAYPYNPGHVMVIPDAHTGDWRELDDETILAHGRLKQRTFDALDEALSPTGYNAGLNLGNAAGGSIGEHLHTHIVPRWGGDTNFMPVLSDTKVIVEAVDDTFERLHVAFSGQQGASGDPGETVRFDADA